jgi:hypothetical protein
MQKLASGVPNFPLVNYSFKLPSSSIHFLEKCEIVGLFYYGVLGPCRKYPVLDTE